MKSRIYTYILILCSALSFANIKAIAGEWTWQNASIPSSHYNTVKIINKNIALACGQNNTLIKTTDGGITWRSIFVEKPENYSQNNTFVCMFFLDSLNGWMTNIAHTIYRTSDGGETWTKSLVDSIGHIIDILFLDKLNGFYICDAGYIYKTIDGGNTWTQTFKTDNYYLGFDYIKFADSLHGFVTGMYNLYKTTDAGVSWDTVPGISGFSCSNLCFIDSGYGWFRAKSREIYGTSNSGATWEKISVTDSGIVINEMFFSDKNNGWALAKDKNLDKYIILKTQDGGITWDNKNLNTSSDPVLGFYNDKYIMYFATNKAYKSEDGGESWQDINKGVQGQMNSVYAIDENNAWAVGSVGFAIKTSNAGKTWEKVDFDSSANFSDVYFTDSQNGWITGNKSYVLNTKNGGATWERVAMPSNLYTQDIIFYGKNKGWLSTTSDTIYKTIDGGQTWASRCAPKGRFLSRCSFVDSLNGWCVGEDTTQHGAIMKTSDGGETWEKIITNGLDRDMTYRLNSVKFTDSLNGWIVGNMGLIAKTNDGGQTWEKKNKKYWYDNNDIHFLDSKTGFIASMSGEIYQTSDGGENWDLIPTSVSANIYKFSFSDINHGWAVGVNGTILRYTDNITAVNDGAQATRASQMSVYPNPSENKCTVSINSSANGAGALKIYSYGGAIIKTIDLGYVQNGKFTYNLDLTNLDCGLFLLVFELNNKRYSIEPIVIKK